MWQHQLNPPAFQFSRYTPITEVVEVTATGYDIALNGKHYIFNHRLDVSSVKQITSALYYGVTNQFSIGKVTVCLFKFFFFVFTELLYYSVTNIVSKRHNLPSVRFCLENPCLRRPKYYSVML